LRYTPGVLAQPFGVDNDTNWLYIRGFDATANGTYLDGLQNFSYGFGGYFIDSFGIERIDVLRGPASALYGGANPGGIVNYISKRPTGERLRYLEAGINS
ncbi:TonB-dependent receptor plug domain-containing protein, partial [Brucella intermedia]|uniref:TonB-dependent receptor plug domain-containing protein n=2 Tax=Brucella/Ochrobactrum group TaxID=2826938 RepID=UPI0015919347